MSLPNLKELSVAQLLELFADIGVRQDKALIVHDNATYNPLFWEMQTVEKELQDRPGDQRRALLKLFEYPNMQVRLAAAKATLAVAPKEARAAIESIAATTWYPQAGDAGMCLINLDRGIFVPK